MATPVTTTEVAVQCADCRRWLTGVTVAHDAPAEVRLKCPKCRAHYVYVVTTAGVQRTTVVT